MTQTPAYTTDRLRHDIDRGVAGDKVVFSDPAAAPLGTDDEAAGTPLSRARIALAGAHETLQFGNARGDVEEGDDCAVPLYISVAAAIVLFILAEIYLIPIR